jgi:hypothetical protein
MARRRRIGGMRGGENHNRWLARIRHPASANLNIAASLNRRLGRNGDRRGSGVLRKIETARRVKPEMKSRRKIENRKRNG